MSTVTTPTAHSRIGASSMHRWAECPGSVRLSANVPNTSSSYAEEGTEAHDLAANILMGQKVDLSNYDEDMVEAVNVYVDAFKESSKEATFTLIEERFDLSKLHPGLFGTSDGIIYHESDKVLQVWDYKHGKGIPVEVDGNEQLMYYGLGALLKTGVPCSHVELVICQPRCPHPEGPIRRWRIDVIDLMDFIADLIDAAKRTEDPNAPLKAGDHCRFCPASPLCPELHKTALTSAQQDFSPSFSYDPAELSKTLHLLPAIKAWVKSVEEFAFNESQHGRIPPGFKLVPKRATRKWRDEDEARTYLALELGLNDIDVFKAPSLKTPAQIEALLSKEDKKKLEDIVLKESSGSTLAPETDKRPTATPAVETQFTVVTE